jgi:PIN domain nuclease of toxin-antitoxin system
MKLLLDTVTFLRLTGGRGEVSARARDLIMSPDTDSYLSTVSAWEISIKYSLGKLGLGQRPEQFVPEHREKIAAQELPLDEESALHVGRLPRLHKDPFDRILISQAIVHGMVLLTPDPVISRYPVRTTW